MYREMSPSDPSCRPPTASRRPGAPLHYYHDSNNDNNSTNDNNSNNDNSSNNDNNNSNNDNSSTNDNNSNNINSNNEYNNSNNDNNARARPNIVITFGMDACMQSHIYCHYIML